MSQNWLLAGVVLFGLLGCDPQPAASQPVASQPATLPERAAADETPSTDAGGATRRAGDAGFRKSVLSYKVGDEERSRNLLVWYPSTKEATRYDYRGQVGFAALDSEVAAGAHPVIVFSHGFLGVADQSIFLMEELARKGYIVAGLNHADSLAARRTKKMESPKFAEPKSWTDQKFRDRREDVAALLDHLLELNGQKESFLFERIDSQAIGACGHSLGGYTVLAMVGAWDSWRDERIKAALLLSPYSTPFLTQGDLAKVTVPVMMQGGTLDWGITPFLPSIYGKLPAPKYYLVLKNETHFGWTNLISLGKTTVEAVQEGNAQLMTDYSVAFLERHLRQKQDKSTDILQMKNPRLETFRHEAK